MVETEENGKDWLTWWYIACAWEEHFIIVPLGSISSMNYFVSIRPTYFVMKCASNFDSSLAQK